MVYTQIKPKCQEIARGVVLAQLEVNGVLLDLSHLCIFSYWNNSSSRTRPNEIENTRAKDEMYLLS